VGEGLHGGVTVRKKEKKQDTECGKLLKHEPQKGKGPKKCVINEHFR
jgi:hypothetical protein